MPPPPPPQTQTHDQECQPARPDRTPLASKRASLRSQFTTTAPSTQHPPADAEQWPVHPIPALRGPFNESIKEAMDPDVRIRRTLDAAARRLQLLELDEFPEDYSTRWRAKPGAKFHPLWKLIAQISFGIHLLHQHTAKSEEEVIRILQTHIDEVDGFLEDTHADFDLAIKDILERARLLQLSLDHGRTFGRMLRNPDFRANILYGNEVIERIIQRTSKALNSSMEDVTKGTEATSEFAKYLDRVKSEWTRNNEDMEGVYEAMRGNAEGWYCCFDEVQEKATRLKELMTLLYSLVKEVSRRAGIAERKVLRDNMYRARSQESVAARPRRDSHRSQSGNARAPQSQPQQQGPLSPTMSTRSKKSLRMSMSKPLPPDPNRRSYAPDPIEPPPPPRSNATIHQTYPEQAGLSRATSAANSIQHSRRPSQSEAYQRHSRQPDTTRSPVFTQSPSQVSPLTPGQMAQLHQLQHLQHRSQQQFNAQAAQILGLTPTDTPLTPDKFLRMLEVANGDRSSQMPTGALPAAPVDSPLTPDQVIQQFITAVNQGGSMRSPPAQAAPAPRSRSSAQLLDRDVVMSQMDGDIPVDLADITEEDALHSPPPSNMLIPVLPDIRESESLHLGDILIGVPSSSSLAGERSPGGSDIRDHEEKQVMSNETFLMLDDIEEEQSKRAQLAEGLAELDVRARSMAVAASSGVPDPAKWSQLELVKSDGPAELDVRKTMNGLDGKKIEASDFAPNLSRQSTKKSTRSTGSGRRSRPHSSYSVLDAYRKSKSLSTGGGVPLLAGDAEEQPPVPSVPSIAYLATEATTPKTPALAIEDAAEAPAAVLEPAKTRNSSDSVVPQLTKSGSTTSVNSATHKATSEATAAHAPSTSEKPNLRLKLEEDAKNGKRAQSPIGPAIVDDGLLELIRPSAKPSPTEAVKLSRSRSVHPAIQSPRGDVEMTLPSPGKMASLFRSNSSKSHKRNSKVSLPSAYSKQASPSVVSPNSIIPGLGSKAVSPATAPINTLVSPAGTTLTAAASPSLPSAAKLESPTLKGPAETILPPEEPALPIPVPSFSRHDSWMSEKVVVVGPPSSDELALLRQSRQAPPPLQSQQPGAGRSRQSSQAPTEAHDPAHQQIGEDGVESKMGHAHKASRGFNRKAAPSPLIMVPPQPMAVEADHGTPRSAQTTKLPPSSAFVPLSTQQSHPTGLRQRPTTSYTLMPNVPPSPSVLSTVSKEALPQLRPTTPGLKGKRFGTLRKPVNAVRGLFKKHQQQPVAQ